MKTKILLLTAVLLLLGMLFGCGAKTEPVESTSAQTVADSTDAADAEETQPRKAAALTKAQAAELYTQYLTNGGYDDVLANLGDAEDDYEAQACLADVNEDGVCELLMHITNKSMGGVRGFPAVTVLFGIADNKVERLGFAYYGGGSGGGDYLFIKYDTLSEKHVLEYEEYVRDGMFFNTYALHYFDVTRRDTQEKEYGLIGEGSVVYKTAHTLRSDTFAVTGAYAQDAEKILQEDRHCKEEDGFVTAYLYDGAYITESDYEALRAQYVEPTDPAYQMKPVTLENPIPAD